MIHSLWTAKNLWLTLLLLSLSCSAQAHRLKVFAQTEGAAIQGQVYFVGGTKAKGAEVRFKNDQGREVGKTLTDEEGRFAWQAVQAEDLSIEADSGDGHQATWTIRAEQLAPAFALNQVPQPEAAPDLIQPGAESAKVESQNIPVVASPQPFSLAELELAIARQIAPLREALELEQDRRRLQDILGGLGYILGLAGLALWWKSRR